MSQPATKEFGKWRSLLWPIHTFELKKFLPMFLLFFFINFVYTILRDTKDTLVVSASGAETIPFLKLYGTIPGAIIFMLIFTKLSNTVKRERLFMGVVAFFAIFFSLYAVFLYPAREALTPTFLTNWMGSHLPQGLNGLVGMIKYWPASLFYIMSELWGSAAVSLLFWGFANQITRVSESKRFYALFGIGANIAMFPSGELIKIFANLKDRLPAGVDTWQVTLNYTMAAVVLACGAAIATYWWINKNVLTDARFYDPSEVKVKKSKPKMSIKESLLFLVRSPYLLAITMLVIGYGMSINLVEVIWKSQLQLQYPDKHAYQHFMGCFSQLTGAITVLMMFFVSGNIIRKKGWYTAAIATPVILGLSAAGFFTFVVFRDQLGGFVSMFGTSPLFFAVMFGMIQNIMSKSTKYSMFDPTKEMAYIPLDAEVKLKGKAAIDVVGARLGKSGGSIILQMLLIVFNAASVVVLAPYIGVILAGVIAAWMFAVKALNKKYTALSAEKEAERLAEENASAPQAMAANKERPAEIATK
ncbi:MAG: AAA family ATPase [Chlamydiae bacterium RIFCSPHIGHO2_12_FULL_44_59]|nr:MAG: AAA family ATPase [Chlamydiae bacterium RIFCSPHIGHO2_01_FULL_44_39]OGN58375.1 MAG: AAA family ATPase [Chlamydiae bacterium RIFCSPHIGHO2_02_FULL_45_9]OGN60916.1 MAG: AAA family ATPase [Chlamydiae bacterium RIFCSPHIGHO2_12_FULL_44_59]OGN66516.1 MAG: AAA family ATPase [Chlamydiae bacterium RIFCSPLOWO2_01_FULL_44_52]OGN69559.1 MAG: AAA family ATPase [Chlamydiae bacterium RIFCSPLOWO2_02_FULL_45_22]OGN70835.1 MAG: AAA family ATPase [Chlamydiae bacterium RIFCSPLOWO2_12_FULL_45_20]